MKRSWSQKTNSNTGLIGIDFGMASTKLVQLGVVAGQFVIQANWCLKHTTNLNSPDLSAMQSALEQHTDVLPTLRRLFVGKRCAATVPMSVTEMRLLELPAASDSERADMVSEELLAELECDAPDLSIGHWPAGKACGQDASMSRYMAYAIPRSLAELVGQRLLKGGWHCQAIDAIPCALARAVQMLGYRRTEDAVLAVDLSHQLPLVVLVVRGVPMFVRPLREAGMNTILEPLCQEFNILNTECHQLLSRFGIPRSDQPATPAAAKTMQVIHQPVSHLLSEIKRTVDYIRQQFPANKPTQICLFGGGASIKNLPQRIGHFVQLPVTTWSLRRNPDHYDPAEAIFGLAAGLSALAMEEQLCT